MNVRFILSTTGILLLSISSLFCQSLYNLVDPDTIRAQKFDMGKMWTFENPPLDYFENEYNFRPDENWLEKVRKSALRFGNGCSASFISSDGLILTNHHCVRGRLHKLNEEGEDLLKEGFYAKTLDDERSFPDLFVDQLLYIEDITEKVHSAMEKGETDSAKLVLRNNKVDELIEKAKEDFPDLLFKTVKFYEGGKYSLYGFKRYEDIRLVFVPELWVAKLGGDYDNFTYPRYGLDCAFLRAYDEEGNPVNSKYYFTWSDEGVKENQPVFVIGNPGSTDRIHTIAQIEYQRDFRYPMLTKMRRDLYNVYLEMVEKTNASDSKLIARLYSVGNGLKVYNGTYKALRNPYLMSRKLDFENKFKKSVKSDPVLNKKYGHIWDEIEKSTKEAATFINEKFAYTIRSYYSSVHFLIAENLSVIAEKTNKNSKEFDEKFSSEVLEKFIEEIFLDEIDWNLENTKLLVQLKIIDDNLDHENKLYKNLFKGNSLEDVYKSILGNTALTDKETVVNLAESGFKAITDFDDPILQFVLNTRDKLKEFEKRDEELKNKNELNNQMLGESFYAVYGDEIPPDATFSLRIADGIVKSYEYNGTKAPYKTTFYGALDRYYSFDKKFPFNLPKYWEDLPDEFDPSTPLDFISTNDIIGGNSGSPVINTDAEIVGVAFDGNIESLPARFIYTTEANRTVAVSGLGMIEAIRDLYKATRLSDEISKGGLN